MKSKYEGLVLINNDTPGEAIKKLIASNIIIPRITQVSGDMRWSARLRLHPHCIVMHLLNRALEAVPHPDLREALSKLGVLAEVKSMSTDDLLEYIIDFDGTGKLWEEAYAMSPELGDVKRPVKIENLDGRRAKVSINLSSIKIYGVIQ